MKTYVHNITLVFVRILGLLLAFITFVLIIDVLLFFANISTALPDFFFFSLGDYIFIDLVITISFLLFLPLSLFYYWERDYQFLTENFEILALIVGNLVSLMIWWLMELGRMEILITFVFLIFIGIANIIIILICAFQPFKRPQKGLAPPGQAS